MLQQVGEWRSRTLARRAGRRQGAERMAAMPGDDALFKNRSKPF
jgi:hypothetical protein